MTSRKQNMGGSNGEESNGEEVDVTDVQNSVPDDETGGIR